MYARARTHTHACTQTQTQLQMIEKCYTIGGTRRIKSY